MTAKETKQTTIVVTVPLATGENKLRFERVNSCHHPNIVFSYAYTEGMP